MKSRMFAGIPLALMLMVFAAQTAPAKGNDELWEMTQKMEGMDMPQLPPGMSMPGMSPTRTCTPKGKTAPPGKKDCKVLEQNQSGDTLKFKVSCPDGLMEGQVTRTSDTMKGKFTMTSKGRKPMTMVMSGKKVGTCDAGEEKKKNDQNMGNIKRQIAQAQAEGAAQTDKTCREQLDMGFYYNYMDAKAPCAKYRKNFCQSITTDTGYTRLVDVTSHPESVPSFQKKMTFNEVANACGQKNLTQNVCGNSLAGQKYGFLKKYCPAESAREKKRAEKVCARWQVTSEHFSKKDYNLCSAYAGGGGNNEDDSGESAPPPSRPAKAAKSSAKHSAKQAGQDAAIDTGTDAAKHALKGLLGF